MQPPSSISSLNLVVALLAMGIAFEPAPLLAQTPRDRAVELNAVAQESPPTITLQWNATGYTVLAQKLYRRLKGGPTWIQIATPANAATSYADSVWHSE